MGSRSITAFSVSLAFLLLTPVSLVAEAAGIQHVFVVSIDGGKPAVIKDTPMPELTSLAQGGAVSWTARTIYPSITLPSHVSMLTGVGPEVHKVLWNGYDPSKGVISVSSVFSQAKAAGKTTAIFASKEKFQHLKVPGTLDHFYYEEVDAEKVAEMAAPYIISKKPNFAFIHFPDADRTGHRSGWGSASQKEALKKIDRALGGIRHAIEKAGIAGESVLIVTADHGGSGFGHGSASDADTQIPWLVWGQGVASGAQLKDAISTVDTAATALWLLGVPIPSSWRGKPVKTAFKMRPAPLVAGVSEVFVEE